MRNYETYILPAYYACYLVNGDRDGYTDEEIEKIDSFLERKKLGHCVDVDIENTYFTHGHDLNRNQGADVCEFTFVSLS